MIGYQTLVEVLPQRQMVVVSLAQRCVVMQVHQAEQDDLAGRVEHHVAPFGGHRARGDGGDPAAIDHHRPAFVVRTGRVERQDHAVAQEQPAHQSTAGTGSAPAAAIGVTLFFAIGSDTRYTTPATTNPA
jgi:hypothetical protein